MKYRYVDPITGRRSDAASRYLYPHAENPNLTIMVGKRVKRVILEYARLRMLDINQLMATIGMDVPSVSSIRQTRYHPKRPVGNSLL